jgi:hypothetical protein
MATRISSPSFFRADQIDALIQPGPAAFIIGNADSRQRSAPSGARPRNMFRSLRPAQSKIVAEDLG